MTHLEVKQDGKIYVIKDCPEAWREYESALASCERIECTDQEHARRLIVKYHSDGNLLQKYSGIYQVDCEWEEKCQYKPDTKWVDCNIEIYNETHNSSEKHLSRKVAILKESPKEEESQEELWKAVSNEINDEGLWLYEDWDGFKLTAKGYKYLMQQFTIARKK